MGIDISNNLSVSAQQTQYKPPVNSETSKTSANAPGSAGSVSDVNDKQKIQSVYEQNYTKTVLEQDLDRLLKQIMPDLGVKFRIHDSGQIITSVVNNETKDVVREFPAEKILDIIHSICQKLGIVASKKA